MFQISREMDQIIHGDEKMDQEVQANKKLDPVIIGGEEDLSKIQNSLERENSCKENHVSHAEDFCRAKNILK